jgi:hypothetical protein
MPQAASTGPPYKERIKSSELLANGLDLDRLQAFTAQLCNEMPRVNEAFRQLEAIRDLELYELEPGVQHLDHGTLSDFIVSMAATYSTAFTKLRKFHKLDAAKREEEKESKLADLRRQEDELHRHKLELEAKEAMLERLREAHRKEEEALALDRKMLHSREMGLEAERRKLLGLGSCPDGVGGVSTLKRDLSGDSELKEADVKRELCNKHEEDKTHSVKRIKLEKEEPNEGVKVERRWSETGEESKMDEEVDVKRASSESDDDLNLECAARREQCHELFDANNNTRHFCFGHPGMRY